MIVEDPKIEDIHQEDDNPHYEDCQLESDTDIDALPSPPHIWDEFTESMRGVCVVERDREVAYAAEDRQALLVEEVRNHRDGRIVRGWRYTVGGCYDKKSNNYGEELLPYVFIRYET
jgi:hypothetical protein